jgi:hypothetical protein
MKLDFVKELKDFLLENENCSSEEMEELLEFTKKFQTTKTTTCPVCTAEKEVIIDAGLVECYCGNVYEVE